METQTKINTMIRKAGTVYVRVSGTEFDVKVSKVEALALNRHMCGRLNTSCVGDPLSKIGGDLYLEGRL